MKRGTVLVLLAGLLAFCIAIRVSMIALPAHDFDEGAYWESLNSMTAGYHLYDGIFYSQPPLFLTLVYGVFAALGKTLTAARVAMVAASALNLIAIAWIGKRIGGTGGALLAVLLLGVNYYDIRQAVTLQAEAPAVAFSTLSVAFALEWDRRRPHGGGFWFAFFAGAAAAAGTLCKLLAVASIAPCCVLLLARRDGRSFLMFAAGLTIVSCAVLAPFAEHFRQLFDQTILFHLPARQLFAAEAANRRSLIESAIFTPLAFAALVGVDGAFSRRHATGVALVVWFVAVAVELSRVTPLFDQHFTALQPPLVALAVYGYAYARDIRGAAFALPVGAVLAVCVAFEISMSVSTIRTMEVEPTPQQRIISEMRRTVPTGSWIVTDDQVAAAVAGLQTPPFLADTSGTRIRTGYLTSAQTISQTSNPRVRAVYIATGRFRLQQMRPFRDWLAANFRHVARFSDTSDYWLRLPSSSH